MGPKVDGTPRIVIKYNLLLVSEPAGSVYH